MVKIMTSPLYPHQSSLPSLFDSRKKISDFLQIKHARLQELRRIMVEKFGGHGDVLDQWIGGNIDRKFPVFFSHEKNRGIL